MKAKYETGKEEPDDETCNRTFVCDFKKNGHGFIYAYCNQLGLYKINV